MEPVNGKEYPMWGQFVDQKDEWIGGRLREQDMGEENETEITDISLEPNGDDSAVFSVSRKDFSCAGDVGYLGIAGTDEHGEEWIPLSGYGGHTWQIKKPN